MSGVAAPATIQLPATVETTAKKSPRMVQSVQEFPNEQMKQEENASGVCTFLSEKKVLSTIYCRAIKAFPVELKNLKMLAYPLDGSLT